MLTLVENGWFICDTDVGTKNNRTTTAVDTVMGSVSSVPVIVGWLINERLFIILNMKNNTY